MEGEIFVAILCCLLQVFELLYRGWSEQSARSQFFVVCFWRVWRPGGWRRAGRCRNSLLFASAENVRLSHAPYILVAILCCLLRSEEELSEMQRLAYGRNSLLFASSGRRGSRLKLILPSLQFFEVAILCCLFPQVLEGKVFVTRKCRRRNSLLFVSRRRRGKVRPVRRRDSRNSLLFVSRSGCCE